MKNDELLKQLAEACHAAGYVDGFQEAKGRNMSAEFKNKLDNEKAEHTKKAAAIRNKIAERMQEEG